MRLAGLITAALALVLSPETVAQDARIDIFIDNDPIGADYRDASWGMASSGDHLRLRKESKMPVEFEHVLVGSSSGLLEYRHMGGSWDLFIASEGWREYDLTGFDSLIVYITAPEPIPSGELPRIGLEDGAKNKSGLISLGAYATGVGTDPGAWHRVSIPLDAFEPGTGFQIDRFQTVRFAHGGINPQIRTLFIDHIHVLGTIKDAIPPPPPVAVETRDGDRSVILRWQPPDADIHGYRIYRGEGAEGPLTELPLPIVTRSDFVDVLVENGLHYRYAVRAVDGQGIASPLSVEVSAYPRELMDDEFVDLVQRTAFDYFWYEGSPISGQVRDRSRPDAVCSIAATGMGLTALTIGIDRGWITHDEGLERVLVTLQTLWEAPQGPDVTGTIGYRGFFYHFLNCDSATRAFGSELSSIDTALQLGGVLHVGTYFTGADEREQEVRALADSIYARVEWPWLQTGTTGTISHGWYPDPSGRPNASPDGFIIHHYRGYDESMILYLLALGSPTYPVDPEAWSAYTVTYDWRTTYGQSFVVFPPLFGHQYSHLWFDFRGIADSFMQARGIDYFENSRRATLANRQYAIHNPEGYPNYGPNEWGLTASDVPDGYLARGAPPPMNDDGTLAPTAPGGSFAFTPQESLAALRTMYELYRQRLWGPYGFRDAYNVAQDWFATDHLGIDQGPFVIMIENHRTERVWHDFMTNDAVQMGLEQAGFQPVDVSTENAGDVETAIVIYPNPAAGDAILAVTLREGGRVRVRLFDVMGRKVATPVQDLHLSPGRNEIPISTESLAPGWYVVRVDSPGSKQIGTFIKR